MSKLQETIELEYAEWEKILPNVVNRGLGFVSKPLEIVLKPIMGKVAPLLEGVVGKTNEYIADAVKYVSDDLPDIENMDEKSFEEWFERADKSASNWKTAGIAAMAAEGGGTGAGGIALLLVDIPAAFGLILGFSNKIALTYGLPIKTIEVQEAILLSIGAGSANNLKEKAAAILALKQAEKTLQMSWKRIYLQAADNISARAIVLLRDFLQKLGIKITKRKAAQIIPAVGALTGAAINGAWAADALEAVRQFSRKKIIQIYKGQ